MRVLITGGGVAPRWRLLIHNAMPKHALVTGAQRVRASVRTVARSEPKAYLELTAALDWCLRSRYDPTPFRHKPVGIVGASPGGGGTARGQMVLRQILLHPPAYVMPEPQILIPFSRQKFDPETGDLVDKETRERLRRFLSALAEWTHRLKEPIEAYQRQTPERRV
jgi:NADPH-dependent FMN reductase